MRRSFMLLALLTVAGCEDDPTAPSGDFEAPAAVSDLRIEMAGSVPETLSVAWTAPGDDGTVGTAASYDLRVSDQEITAANFALATALTGLPVPAAAGAAETFVLPDPYQTGSWYLALRTADEAANTSLLSNVIATPLPVDEFPLPTTPQIWVENFERAYEQLDIVEYEAVLHPDFTFWFSPADIFEVGALSWSRSEELAASTNMFSGVPGSRTTVDGGTEIIPAVTSISFSLTQVGEWTESFDDGSEYAEADVRGTFDVDMVVRYAESDMRSLVIGRQIFYLTRRGMQVDEGAQDLYHLFAWRDVGNMFGRAVTEALTWGSLKARF